MLFTSNQVTGEATPGYLFCITCPTYILKYIPKVPLLKCNCLDPALRTCSCVPVEAST